MNNRPEAPNLNPGDIIQITSEGFYSYEEGRFIEPEEMPGWPARILEIRPTSTGHAVHCNYLDSGEHYIHPMLNGDTVLRIKETA